MFKFYALGLVIAITATTTFGQTYPDNHPPTNDPLRRNLTPASPDAWQFMKYGQYPVSRVTGVPNISIPIYTISTGDLSVPIDISYHASGIKVDEVSSWIGLGWTLNAGGMISRTTRGLTDECTGGILFQNLPYYDANHIWNFSYENIDIGTETDYMNMMRIRSRGADGEPDIFNYTFGGYSGRFFLDPKTKTATQCKGVTQPKTDIDITAYFEEVAPNDRRITSILAVTPEGTRYTFDVICTFDDGAAFGNASWYLSKIQSQNDADEINFHYKDYISQVYDRYYIESVMLQYNGPGYTPVPSATRYAGSSQDYTGVKVPDYITFPSGKVVFNSVNDRLDDHTMRLSSIDVFDYIASSPIKSFLFGNKNYFASNNYTPSVLQVTTRNMKRLKLASLQEFGMNGEYNPPYEFTYNETDLLPPRHSCAQDYWGYYNGANDNVSLIPLMTITTSEVPFINYNELSKTAFGIRNVDHTMGTAYREADAGHMQAGVLKTIKYPAGGKTDFVFESNTVLNSYIQQNVATTESHHIANVTPPSARHIYSEPFTPEQNFQVTIDFAITYVGYDQLHPPTMDSQLVYLELDDLTDNVPLFRREASYYESSILYTLTAGHQYQVQAYSSFTDVAVIIDLYWMNPPETVYTTVTENKTVGGLRIKRITNWDDAGAMAGYTSYDYSSYNQQITTSGKILSQTSVPSGHYISGVLPTPKSYLTVTTYAHKNLENDYCEVDDYWYSATAYPSDPSGFPSGEVVEYEYVTETVGNQTDMGSTVYHYDVQNSDRIFSGYHTTFLLDRSWLRGQPLDEFYLDRTGKIVKEVNYAYETVDVNDVTIRGVRVEKYIEVTGGAGDVCLCDAGSLGCTPDKIAELRHGQVRFSTYDESIQWKRLTSKTEKLDNVVTLTTFEYDPAIRHTNVVALQTIDSDNTVSRTETNYAYELGNSTMIEKNMVGIALETNHKTDVNGNNNLAGGSRTAYDMLDNFFIPLRFQERLTNGSYETKSEAIAVNAAGRIETISTREGIINGFKWGYHNQHPIVKIVNARAKDVFYTSFEEGDGSVDTNSKTGIHVSAVNCTIALSNLTPGQYELTYWKRSGQNWALISTPVTVASDSYNTTLPATTAEPIDEVRFYPVGSQLTTYTYSPLLGITSTTDANNKTMYYMYDNFGRLQVVKDNDGNIVSNYLYHFKQN